MTRVGYVPGVFDLFHVGHLNILRNASASCDRLVAGVVTDEVVQAVKGFRPVVPFVERLEIVRALTVVDDAVPDTSGDKTVAWRANPFDVIFKGDDWRGTAKGDALERDLGALGVEVVYFPYTEHTSSTMLRDVLKRLAGSL